MKSCQLIKRLYSGVSEGRKSAGDASGSAGKCAEVESNLHIKTRNEKSDTCSLAKTLQHTFFKWSTVLNLSP